MYGKYKKRLSTIQIYSVYSSLPEYPVRRRRTAGMNGEANRVDLSRPSLDEVGISQERSQVGYDATWRAIAR
jgi:hypothetical protein